VGSGRMLFGRRSGTGRKTYRCRTCGRTARHGLPDNPVADVVPSAPGCPCGGEMVRWDPPKNNKGAGKAAKRHP
jgi:hypothetical protein